MKLGYFTLTDNPPAYAEQRKDPNRFLQEVLEECIYAEELRACEPISKGSVQRGFSTTAGAYGVGEGRTEPG